MSLEHLRGLNGLSSVNKQWIYSDSLHRELAHDYLQKVSFCIQDVNYLLGTSGRIEKRADVISLIVMVDWIVDSVWQYKSCLSEGLIDAFRFSGQNNLEKYYVFLKALRSIAVAHPLNTNKHKDLGLDGDIICIDLRIDQPVLFTIRDSAQRFGVNGIESYDSTHDDDVYLYVYSKKADAQYFEFLVVDLAAVVYVACAYINQLYELDKYLSKLKK